MSYLASPRSAVYTSRAPKSLSAENPDDSWKRPHTDVGLCDAAIRLPHFVPRAVIKI